MARTVEPMTSGTIWKRMVFFAFPLFLGNLFQQLYNTVDSLIVGNFLGSSALAAVSSSGSLIFMLIGFLSGIAGGAGVVLGSVSRAVVDDDDEVHSRDGAAGPDGGGDALSLILGRDDHGNALVGPLVGTHAPRVSRLPASSRYLSAPLPRARLVRPVKFSAFVPRGADSSGSPRSGRAPATP